MLIYTPALGQLLDWTGSNYRFTFLLSGIFSALSLVLLMKVYFTFMKLGGPAGYIAPLPEGTVTRGFDVGPPVARH
ncbi:MAG: hypothetical protein QM754_04420 [Tepidisphaeraceae bacterium]